MTRNLFRLIMLQMKVQLKTRIFNLYSFLLFFLQPAIFSGVGMLLSKAAGHERPDFIYTIIGGGMLGMWSGLVFTSTFDISSDRRDGTLELIVASPISLGVVEAFRTFTNVIAGLISMTAAFIVAVVVFNFPFSTVNIPGSLLSLLMTLLSMWAIGVFLANFLIWSRLSGSLVEFLEIPIALVCGFMYPIWILPDWLQTISMLVPMRWAIEGLYGGLRGRQDIAFFLARWGTAMVLSLIFWGISHWLERKVHDRIRVTGEMSSI